MHTKMKLFIKNLVGLSLILLLVFSVTACGTTKPTTGEKGAVDAGKPVYGGILKIVNPAEGAQPLGVPWQTTTIDTLLMTPVVENLVREDTSGNIHPYLATEWKIDKTAKTITFTLRKGVKFHDGTDFNAQAVVFNWEQTIAAKQVPGWTGVKLIDDYTVQVTYENYSNAYLSRAAGKVTGIISPTAFKEKGLEASKFSPVGTGPFKFESFTRGQVLKYTKNENYWQEGKPYLDGIHYLFMRDAMTQNAAMQASGDQRLDALNTTSGEQATQMAAQGFEVLKMPIGPVSLIPDSNDPKSPLANAKVREAISYAIDREGISKARGFGIWTPAYQFTPEGWLSHIPDAQFKNTTYDTNKAKQILTEAGYPNGFTTKIIVMPGLVDKDAMVAIQQSLSKIGIKVDLEFPDNGGYTNYRMKGWSGLLAQHTRSLSNFNNTMTIYWLPNGGQFPNMKRADGLIDAINASVQTEKVDAPSGQKISKIIADDTMVIPVYNVYDLYITNKNLHDAEFTKWGSSTVFIPENAWLSK